MDQLGARLDTIGKWTVPDGRQVLNKQITRGILRRLHHQTHWGVQAMCDTILRDYVCRGIYTLAQQEVVGCPTCLRINQKAMRSMPAGGQPLAIRPFQRIQVDFTELPPVQRWKYLLVIVDHFTHWVEAFPTAKDDAPTVARLLLENIIPRYGIMESIDSDCGTHFISKLHHLMCNALGIQRKFHTPWHPQSSGRVERMNGTLKTQLTKLMLETKLPWPKCLPIALMRIRTAPRRDVGVSPYEMFFGLPYWSKVDGCTTLQGGMYLSEPIYWPYPVLLQNSGGKVSWLRLRRSTSSCIRCSPEIGYLLRPGRPKSSSRGGKDRSWFCQQLKQLFGRKKKGGSTHQG
ncbi:uncharacterized protein LOC122552397 [Chiloscyllium plagiosum]|uniref:uncharacterized protein LOC122552397 n=1 Tax=Chiloscyllium plagiosum TaxID=36176 RepID=UPI001CB80B43|nr:uncharacterized protein LOC122552397 [Chiloscyllium plagiosum]XP_043551083.1 uncharacterized protein LOC122552397 [Chiloscyllium plagiosum]